MSDAEMLSVSRKYYERHYEAGEYSAIETAAQHAGYEALKDFITAHGLATASTLEIGSGKGLFQDLVEEYTGLDVAEALRGYYRDGKTYVVGSGNDLPFADDSFDFIFSIQALEHIPSPARVLSEIRRTIRSGGLVYLAPAWQCRPWAAQGYPVRPYSDLDWRGKLVKASIPLRNSVMWRALGVFPRRIAHTLAWCTAGAPTEFRYKEIEANYETRWMSDSDAVNSMDPYEVILWFVSRGDICISYPTMLSAFLVRTGPIAFRIRKDGK